MSEYLEKGEAALQAGDIRHALGFFGRALRVEPRNPRVWLGLAEAVDEPAKKRECIDHALRLDPLNPQALEALDRLESQAEEALPAWFDEIPAPVLEQPVEPAALEEVAAVEEFPDTLLGIEAELDTEHLHEPVEETALQPEELAETSEWSEEGASTEEAAVFDADREAGAEVELESETVFQAAAVEGDLETPVEKEAQWVEISSAPEAGEIGPGAVPEPDTVKASQTLVEEPEAEPVTAEPEAVTQSELAESEVRWPEEPEMVLEPEVLQVAEDLENELEPEALEAALPQVDELEIVPVTAEPEAVTQSELAESAVRWLEESEMALEPEVLQVAEDLGTELEPEALEASLPQVEEPEAVTDLETAPVAAETEAALEPELAESAVRWPEEPEMELEPDVSPEAVELEAELEPEPVAEILVQPAETEGRLEDIPVEPISARPEQPGGSTAVTVPQAAPAVHQEEAAAVSWRHLPFWGKLAVGVFTFILASSLMLFGYAWAAGSDAGLVNSAISLGDFSATGMFLVAALMSYLALREPAAREWLQDRSPLLEVVIFLAFTQLLASLGNSVMSHFTNLPFAAFSGTNASLNFASQFLNGVLMIVSIILGIGYLRRRAGKK